MSRLWTAVFGLLPLFPPQVAAGASLRVVLPDENPTLGWVEWGPLADRTLEVLRTLDASQLDHILWVRVEAAGALPNVLGEHRVVDRTLRFTPRFPWRPGLGYRTTLKPPGETPQELSFQIPEVESRPNTLVQRIHPDHDVIPANLLRFYVEFTAPMSAEDALPFVTLLDGDDRPIEGAFVQTEPLWDPGRRRLTLLCHPGRIKRGLQLHDRMGPPLREGARATLLIGEGLRDAWGQPLAAEARREYRVSAADRTPPDPDSWTIHAPRRGSSDPLVVEFGETLDLQLLARMLTLREVSGEQRVAADGQAWEFWPARPWERDAVELLVDAGLEDLAGNRIDAPFEQTNADTTAAEPFRLRIELRRADR